MTGARAVSGLQKRGAQGRRQDDRNQHGEGHRGDDCDRELAVDDAGRAREEGHRDEHRRQDDGDANQRAGDLLHGLDGGIAWREAFLFDQTLHILDHDDRIVDQKADREHHREHGQRVDGHAEQKQDAECAQQHDRHSNHRNDCGAQVLQENEDHDENEDDGLNQRVLD